MGPTQYQVHCIILVGQSARWKSVSARRFFELRIFLN